MMEVGLGDNKPFNNQIENIMKLKDIKKRTDGNGDKIKNGDLLLEPLRGYSIHDGEIFYSVCFWYYYGQHDSSGYYYDIMGELRQFWHVSTKNSFIVDKKRIDKKLLYTINHGRHDGFRSTLKEGDLYDIIDCSNWRERILTPKEVKRYKKEMKEIL